MASMFGLDILAKALAEANNGAGAGNVSAQAGWDSAPGAVAGKTTAVAVVPLVYGSMKVQGNLVFAPPEFWKLEPNTSGEYTQYAAYGFADGPIIGIGKTWIGDQFKAALPDWGKDPNDSLVDRITAFLGARAQTLFSFSSDQRLVASGTVAGDQLTITDPNYVAAQPVSVYSYEMGRYLVEQGWLPLTSREFFNRSGAVLTFLNLNYTVVDVVYYALTAKFTSYGSYGFGGTAGLKGWIKLGKATSMPNVYAEVHGLLGSGDVNPADVIEDLLGNTIYGLGLPAATLSLIDLGQDGTAASSGYRFADQSALKIAARMTTASAASNWIQTLLAGMDSVLVWSDGKIRLYPRAEADVGTFTAWKTPTYDLDTDHFQPQGDDGAIIVRSVGKFETANEVPVQFIEREPTGTDPSPDSYYSEAEVTYGDEADIAATGARRADGVQTFLTNRVAAQKLSCILSRRAVYQTNEYSFELSGQMIMLEPWDLLTITDALHGLDHRVVRITALELTESDTIQVTAEDWLGLPHPAGLGEPETGDPQLSQSTDPPLVCTSAYIRLNPDRRRAPEVLIGTSAINDNWSGAEVWLSWDNVNYWNAGLISQGATHGYLMQDLPAGNLVDETNTARIECEPSRTVIPDGTADKRDACESLILIGDELVAYASSELVSGEDYQYDVSSLRRGVLGSFSAAHGASELCCLLTDSLLRVEVDPEQAGKTLYVKLRARNAANTATLELDDLSPYQYVIPDDLGLPPTVAAPLHIGFDQFDVHDYDIETSGSILSEEESGEVGGRVLRATGGEVALIAWTNIVFNPQKIYRLHCRIRQIQDPTSGTKEFTAGLVGIEADGLTWNGKTGLETLADQVVGPSAVEITEGTDWTTYDFYWEGVATPGTDGSAAISAPGVLRTGTKYLRPFFIMNGGSTGGIQEIDELTVVEIVDGGEIKPRALTYDRLSSPVSLNCWPNGNSEAVMPDDAITVETNVGGYFSGKNYAAEFGNIESGSAYAGSKCRKLTTPTSVSGEAQFDPVGLRLPAAPGQTYFLEAMVSRVSGVGAAYVRIMALDSSNTILTYVDSTHNSATWTRKYVQLTMPAGTVAVELLLFPFTVTAGDSTVARYDSIQAYLDPGFYRACGLILSDGTVQAKYGSQELTITRTGTGAYRIDESTGGVNWEKAVVNLTPGNNAISCRCGTAASSIYVYMYNSSGSLVDSSFHFSIMAF